MDHQVLVLILSTVLILPVGLTRADACPSKCTCKHINPQGELLKVTCEDDIREIRAVDLSTVSNDVVHLDLSKNRISDIRISLFKNLTNLKRLNLSNNYITLIDEGAFDGLSNLENLDLSKNHITTIDSQAFKRLPNLKRLKINGNKLESLKEGIFHNVHSLKILDASSNPWNCDCNLYWLSDWMQNGSVKMNPPPKCDSPFEMRGKLVRKLRIFREAECRQSMPIIEILPDQDQVVFAGDPITLKCRAPSITNDKHAKLNWLWNSNVTADILDLNMYNNVQSSFTDIAVENKHLEDSGTVSSLLSIDPVKESHHGQWNCLLESTDGNISRAINVIVISNSTQYCPLSVTRNNKGVYAWPRTVIGWKVELPCDGNGSGLTEISHMAPRATYRCNDTGQWIELDTENCPYVSTTTRILEQFAKVNITLTKTLLETIKKLKNITENGAGLTDPVEIEFVVQAIENNAKYLVAERELGTMLLDIINVLLNLPKSILKSAEVNYRSCTKLLRVIELIVENTPPTQLLQMHKRNMALEQYRVKPETFDGIICNWYSNSENVRLLACSLNNATNIINTSNGATTIEASLQLPATLFANITTKVDYKLMISMYSDNKLFPKTNNIDNKDITTSIVGSKIIGLPALVLKEPVYVMLKVPAVHYAGRNVPKPAVWDPLMNNASGGWSGDGCHLVNYHSNLIFFHCNRLGYYGLLQDKSYYSADGKNIMGAKFKYSNPGIYVGSFILLVCLICSIVTYVCCYTSIAMPKKAKHCIVNTWIAMALLSFLYTFGIQQTEDVEICEIVGIGLHYLSLCSLFWMAVSANNMYKRLSKSVAVDPITDDDELQETPIRKPILGIYLVGWGISTIICGIFGAINLHEYAGYSHCFLNTIPSLASLFVPASVLILYLTILHALIRCTIRNADLNGQLSEGTQATENVDLELLEPNANPVTDRVSMHSSQTVSSEVEDQEHSQMTQLKGLVIIMILYLAAWSCAALATANLFEEYLPYEETVFAALYAVFAGSLGMFILLFYGIARSDVRCQWLKMRCWLRKRKNQCCRTRGVSDVAGPVIISTQPLVPTLVALPNAIVIPQQQQHQQHVITTDSNSIASSKLTHKSHSSCNTSKQASDHGQRYFIKASPNHQSGGTPPNSNLLMIHRQQYRSNNSVITYNTESAPASVEMFYNPHQSGVARKFFKRQRRNMKKSNNLGPRKHGDVGLTSDAGSCVSVPCRSAKIKNDADRNSVLCSGSKVNNTNIHVEPNPVNDARNMNMLSDEGNRNLMHRNIIGEKNIEDKKINTDAPITSNELQNRVPDSVINHGVCDCPYESDSKIEEEEKLSTREASQQCSLDGSCCSEIDSLTQIGSEKSDVSDSSSGSETEKVSRCSVELGDRLHLVQNSVLNMTDDYKTARYGSLSSLPLSDHKSLSSLNKNYRNSIADTSSLRDPNKLDEVGKRNSIAAIALDVSDHANPNDEVEDEASSVEALQLYDFQGEPHSGDDQCSNSDEDLEEPEMLNIKKETSV